MNEKKNQTTENAKGEDKAREAAAAKPAGMTSAGMSKGWSVMWDTTALGELQARGRQHPEEGEKGEGAKGLT